MSRAPRYTMGETPRDRRTPAESFIAQWPDVCADCHEEIRAGQRAHYREGLIVHHTHDRAQQPEIICPACWLVVPASGACGCEEVSGTA